MSSRSNSRHASTCASPAFSAATINAASVGSPSTRGQHLHNHGILHGRFGGAPLLADEPDLREQIERQVEELKADGFDAELKVANGTSDTPELIAHAAIEVDADLIVLCTHGHGGLKSAVVGSVARGLLHRSSCTVLAIPPERGVAETARDGEKATVA